MNTNPKFRITLAAFLLTMVFLNADVLWRAWWQVVAGYPDFSIFYSAALILRRGEGKNLYDNQLQLQVQREFATAAQSRLAPLPYNHPPFEAVPFIPLTYLSYLHAYGVWAAINLILLAGIVWFLHRTAPCLYSTLPWLPMLAALAFFPIAYAVMQGQDSILLLALYALAYWSFRRGRDLEAGAWLGLGLFKFHLVLPFVFILLLRRRLRAVWGTALSGCLVGLVSLILVGWRELLFYPRYAWQVNRQALLRVIVPENMPNLRGLLTSWSWAHSVSPWPQLILAAASLMLLFWAAWQWQPQDLSNLTAWNNGFSIAMIATFLVSYHVYNQDMSMLFLPLLLLFDRLLQTTPEGWRKIALKATLLMMFFTPLYLALTLHFEQQHLFALVLLGLAMSLAGWSVSLNRDAEAEGLARP